VHRSTAPLCSHRNKMSLGHLSNLCPPHCCLENFFDGYFWVWRFFSFYNNESLKWLNTVFIFSLNTKTSPQNLQFKRPENLELGPAEVRHIA